MKTHDAMTHLADDLSLGEQTKQSKRGFKCTTAAFEDLLMNTNSIAYHFAESADELAFSQQQLG